MRILVDRVIYQGLRYAIKPTRRNSSGHTRAHTKIRMKKAQCSREPGFAGRASTREALVPGQKFIGLPLPGPGARPDLKQELAITLEELSRSTATQYSTLSPKSPLVSL